MAWIENHPYKKVILVSLIAIGILGLLLFGKSIIKSAIITALPIWLS